jgi:excisionase family DNA binding protein
MRADDAFTPITPAEDEEGVIKQLVEVLKSWYPAAKVERDAGVLHWRLLPPEGEPRPLPPSLVHGLRALILTLSQGEGAAVVPLSSDLTTQEAADLLGVSRPHLIRLLDQGELPHRKVGTHRRLRAEHVLDYRREQRREQRFALAALTEQSERLGLYSKDVQHDPSPVDNLDMDDAENRTG